MKWQSYFYVLVSALWVLVLANWFKDPRGAIGLRSFQSMPAAVHRANDNRTSPDPGYAIPEKRLSQSPPSIPVSKKPKSSILKADPVSRSRMQSTVDRYIETLAANGFSAQTQGVWVQAGSEPVAQYRGTQTLPGASLTKVATTLVALHKLGADHRFWTQVAVSGPVNDGVVEGDLWVQGGNDPLFVWQSADELGRLLNQRGIRQVQGDLIIVGPFAMNFERDPLTAGTLLKRAWNREGKPQISILGEVRVATAPFPSSALVVRYPSKPLILLLKQMNNYSNNIMAEMIGQAIGGVTVLNRTTSELTGLPDREIRLINASGLGRGNQVSPRAACSLLSAIQAHLQTQSRDIRDVFPIATIDRGTLANRRLPAGTIAKTGTLRNVSTLVGFLPGASNPPLCFAILNSGSDLPTLRRQQDSLVRSIYAVL